MKWKIHAHLNANMASGMHIFNNEIMLRYRRITRAINIFIGLSISSFP